MGGIVVSECHAFLLGPLHHSSAVLHASLLGKVQVACRCNAKLLTLMLQAPEKAIKAHVAGALAAGTLTG